MNIHEQTVYRNLNAPERINFQWQRHSFIPTVN